MVALLETGPVGASELAELMGLTTGAVTRMVDRLTRGGYVRREQDPDDRRRVVPERIARIGQYYQAMETRWREQIGQYTDAELEFLLEFLRQGRENTQLRHEKTRTIHRTDGAGHHLGRRRRERGAAHVRHICARATHQGLGGERRPPGLRRVRPHRRPRGHERGTLRRQAGDPGPVRGRLRHLPQGHPPGADGHRRPVCQRLGGGPADHGRAGVPR